MPPIATDLETDRLRYRERRLVRALTVLESRAERLYGAARPLPAPLAAAIHGFREDLAATRERLR